MLLPGPAVQGSTTEPVTGSTRAPGSWVSLDFANRPGAAFIAASEPLLATKSGRSARSAPRSEWAGSGRAALERSKMRSGPPLAGQLPTHSRMDHSSSLCALIALGVALKVSRYKATQLRPDQRSSQATGLASPLFTRPQPVAAEAFPGFSAVDLQRTCGSSISGQTRRGFLPRPQRARRRAWQACSRSGNRDPCTDPAPALRGNIRCRRRQCR